MTESTPIDEGTGDRRRCRWCRRILPDRSGPGRPREFCSQACRQWDWVARQRAADLRLSEHELVISRDELDRLQDDLYVLECALEDTERDMTAWKGQPSVRELRSTLEWLVEAARPLTGRQISAPKG